ncbi:DUF4168 domain-containing protein [Sphingomonas montanisoli]|uniref:DUF4168 domain-containing protein n=1 Tax=Sphingomonas montanisoli TaxID=2606412 RepID=UPI0015E191AE|nr:DUF4168 domain-containing protein [Sphingomonas montanisoli]
MRSLLTLVLCAAVWIGVGEAVAAPSAPAQRIDQAEITRYASALLEILNIRAIANQRERGAAPTRLGMLREQADAAIAASLADHGLNKDRFNQITAAVAARPALERQVRQHVMRERLGYR